MPFSVFLYKVKNSKISNNKAGQAAAIEAYDGSIKLTNSVVSNNESIIVGDYIGIGVVMLNNNSGTLEIDGVEFNSNKTTYATVYVTSATHNWNHPHSTAVIIDSEKNMIEFAQLG